MAHDLSRALRNEMEWAIAALTEGGSPSAHSLDTIHRAIRAQSPMLPKRFQLFVDNSAPLRLEREDQNRIGTLLLALEAWASGQSYRLYQPGEFDGEKPRGQSEVIQFRCTSTFKARLRAYSERTGHDTSRIIRRAVEAHLKDNPLWQEFSGETEVGEEEGQVLVAD